MEGSETVDVLAIGAHPDDVELHVGGTLLRLASMGYRTGVVDLTRGECATRGSPEERAEEASAASRVLGLACRENLGLGDGRLADVEPARIALVHVLRRLRPRLVFTHHPEQPHPDHVAAAELVVSSVYLAGLARWHPLPDIERHRPDGVVHFGLPRSVNPGFVIDISFWREKKWTAIRCHRSQWHDPARMEPETAVSEPMFLERIAARDRYHGSLIQVEAGEAFCIRDTLAIEDPVRALCRTMDVLP